MAGKNSKRRMFVITTFNAVLKVPSKILSLQAEIKVEGEGVSLI